MAIQANGANLLLGRGKVFFKRSEAAGTGRGLQFLGQVTQFELRPKDEMIQEKSAVEAAAPIVAEVKVSTDHEVGITFKEMIAHNLALALMGTVGSYTQAGTGVTNEAFTDVKQGTYIKLAKRGPISAVTVTGSGGSPTYTVTTDYVIEDSTEGLIYIVPGGAIADGADIEVDYTPTAIATGLPTVAGGVSSFIEGELLFLPDPAKGPKWRAEIWKVSINSQAVIALIQSGNEFAAAEITGRILSDATNHPSEPYYKLTQVGTV